MIEDIYRNELVRHYAKYLELQKAHEANTAQNKRRTFRPLLELQCEVRAFLMDRIAAEVERFKVTPLHPKLLDFDMRQISQRMEDYMRWQRLFNLYGPKIPHATRSVTLEELGL